MVANPRLINETRWNHVYDNHLVGIGISGAKSMKINQEDPL